MAERARADVVALLPTTLQTLVPTPLVLLSVSVLTTARAIAARVRQRQPTTHAANVVHPRQRPTARSSVEVGRTAQPATCTAVVVASLTMTTQLLKLTAGSWAATLRTTRLVGYCV
jgi:hypothetical protein